MNQLRSGCSPISSYASTPFFKYRPLGNLFFEIPKSESQIGSSLTVREATRWAEIIVALFSGFNEEEEASNKSETKTFLQYVRIQGDQIGQIFASWASIYFGKD
jgi:hypothetical protein